MLAVSQTRPAAVRPVAGAAMVIAICAWFVAPAMAAEPVQLPGIKVQAVTAAPGYPPVSVDTVFDRARAVGVVSHGSPDAGFAGSAGGLLTGFGRQLAPTPGAESRADFDGQRGAARLSSGIDMLGATGATLTVYDRLDRTQGTGPLTFRLRVDTLSMSVQGAGTAANFFVGVSLHDGTGYDLDVMGFGYSMSVDEDGRRSEGGFAFAGPDLLLLDRLPGTFERAFTFSPPAGALHLRWQISGGTESSLGEGAADIAAFRTAYLGIDGDYVSQAGFSYPGFQAPVPELPGALLMLAGLVGLAPLLRMRLARG